MANASSGTKGPHVGRLIGALLVACSACGDAPERTGRASGALQGGIVDAADPYAVAVYDVARARICTGVLLAPNLVMTARHCVGLTTTLGVECSTTRFSGALDPSEVWVMPAATVAPDSAHVQARAIRVPAETLLCGNDLALVILDGSIPGAPATPVLTSLEDDPSTLDAKFTAIGYGVSDPSVGARATAGVRRALLDVAITCVGRTSSDGCASVGATVTAGEFVAAGGGCAGDSGSGAFAPRGVGQGAPRVFGVLSRGPVENGECVKDVYTRTDAWRGLIVAAAVEASRAGGYAPAAWTGATPEDGGAADGAASVPHAAEEPPAPNAPLGPLVAGGCAMAALERAGAPSDAVVLAGFFLALAGALRRGGKRVRRRSPEDVVP